jgi:hypothetical protein
LQTTQNFSKQSKMPCTPNYACQMLAEAVFTVGNWSRSIGRDQMIQDFLREINGIHEGVRKVRDLLMARPIRTDVNKAVIILWNFAPICLFQTGLHISTILMFFGCGFFSLLCSN